MDQQLLNLARVTPPKEGWLRAVRQALGMSLEAFGKRIGASGPTAHYIESAEVSGALTLRRLRSAAEALGCDVTVTLTPRKRLETLLQEQALRVAREQVARTGHSMAMEAQGLSAEDLEIMASEAAEEMIRRGDPRIWK